MHCVFSSPQTDPVYQRLSWPPQHRCLFQREIVWTLVPSTLLVEGTLVKKLAVSLNKANCAAATAPLNDPPPIKGPIRYNEEWGKFW